MSDFVTWAADGIILQITGKVRKSAKIIEHLVKQKRQSCEINIIIWRSKITSILI